MNDRVSYPESIALQPQSLKSGLTAIRRQLERIDLDRLRTGTVVVTGIGASLHAAAAGAAHMRTQGLRAYALAAPDLYETRSDVADAYIALSASGRSVEPARAMESRRGCLTFGITKRVETPLKAIVGTTIATESGADGVPNTTSYLGSLLALGLMADKAATAPSGCDWEQLPGLVARVLDRCREQVAIASSLLAGRTWLDCVGDGTAFGAAGYAALLLREAVRVPAQQWSTLNFLHGPMEPNDERTGVILFGAGREVSLARDLARFGIATVLVTDRDDIHHSDSLVVIHLPGFSAGLPQVILQALPTQLVVAKLMEQAGLHDCQFRYRQTDTKLPDGLAT